MKTLLKNTIVLSQVFLILFHIYFFSTLEQDYKFNSNYPPTNATITIDDCPQSTSFIKLNYSSDDLSTFHFQHNQLFLTNDINKVHFKLYYIILRKNKVIIYLTPNYLLSSDLKSPPTLI